MNTADVSTKGDGIVLTDSRFLTADNGGAIDPGRLSVHLAAGTDAAGTLTTANSVTALASSDASEIALVRTNETSTGPLIGMVVYADPTEASGAFTAAGYSRANDGAAPSSLTIDIEAGDYQPVTLKNRTGANDVWLTTVTAEDAAGGPTFGSVYQSLDIDGDGTSTDYLAGLIVGPIFLPTPDIDVAIDPIGDVYASLVAELQASGVAADDIGRSALIASSAGGVVEGTFLNEDFLGSAAADTQRGFDGDDFLSGLGGGDSLDGGTGDDTIRGGEGGDTLRGRAGNDSLEGGGDADRLVGNAGSDTLFGGDGNDTINGGGDDDVVHGDDGVDRIGGQNGNDTLFGGDGIDRLSGGAGDDSLDGGEAVDRIFGGADDDTLLGGGGRDTLYGGAGEDTLLGGADADRLFGGGDDDDLNGGAGNDYLDGGAGLDTLFGDDGEDRFCFSTDGGDTVTDFTMGEDQLNVRKIGVTDLSGLTLTTIAAGQVEVESGGLVVTLFDGDGVADFTAADFTAADFIFA